MKITADISNPLLRRARALAAERGITLSALVEEGLRQVMARQAKPVKPFKLKLVTVKGRGLTPEAEKIAGPNCEKIRYLAYEPWPTEDELK